ncbi:MAG TPA: class I adenylate-forming enzyme family protein [Polyangiaceae bacterium]|nr:class I adenylate-forming enzyme family protein [Polyangiaceae bacterium]
MRLETPEVAFRRGDDIASLLRGHAWTNPGRRALIDGDRTLSYAELDSRVDRIGAALAASSVGPGGRVAVLAANDATYVAVFFATLRAGASIVPLPTLSSREALEAMLDDSGAAVLFVGRGHEELGVSLAARRALLRVALDDGVPRGLTPLTAFLARAENAPDVAIGPNDEFDVIYSSGTTGTPKGIVHSHGARKASYAGSRARWFSPESVNVVATPLYSNTTCITFLLTTATGGTNVLFPKFSADAFLDAVETHRATHAMLVPTQYDRIVSSPRFPGADLSSLRVLFSTSAPLPSDMKRRVLSTTNAELVEIYGLTEGGPVTVLEARRHPDKLGTVGKPAPGTELRVVDERGEDVPAGTAGEVVGRSGNMMSGYLNRPDENAAIVFRDATGKLYFRTGDVGRLDADGFLHLLDRKKDVIISGGFNVYATDLESVLLDHPDVQEAAVIGVPSERWGETPLALVVLKSGAHATADAIREYLNAKVGKAQRASAVELRTELPKSAIGKVLKRELREPYWRRR